MCVPNLAAHPRLLMTAQNITEMKSRIEHCDWAREQWRSVKEKADEALNEEIILPPRGGNWPHWYACPVHDCPLSKGKQIGSWRWEHKCPVGGETLLGDPSTPSKDYDSCVLADIHTKWALAILDLGIAYQITDDTRYSSKARDILLAYSKKYLAYPLHDIYGRIGPQNLGKDDKPALGGGRVGPQNLDEAVWLIPVCQGADLVWDTLTQADRDTISNNMLMPAVKDVLMPNPLGIHNIQCWRNSAIGLVGFLLGDKDLISYAIDNPDTGFRAQITKGVTADGQWWEGAWSYHFYTVSAIWSLTEAARNCGIDLYCREFKSMFDAPLAMAMPNMYLPAFNDSGEVNLESEEDLYELAYARYKNPVYLGLLDKSDRHNNFALFYGEPKLPAVSPMNWKSTDYPHSGYAVLTKGKREMATWLCMKYGPYGTSHGHPDKLSFVLYAKGHVLGIDSGTSRYGLPIHSAWYKTTLSHNTLTVDEESQKPVEGRVISFGTEKGVDFALCDAGPIQDGVHFTRAAVMLDENLIIFIDQIRSDKDHIYDIAYHQCGKWTNIHQGTAWNPPDKLGYSYLKDAIICGLGKGINLGVDVAPGNKVMLGAEAENDAEVITATGVGANIADRVLAVIFRKHAKDMSLAWYISLDGSAVRIERLSVNDEGGTDIASPAVAVMVTDATGKKWCLLSNPEKREVAVLLPDGSMWRGRSLFAVK